jgi:hypothetical protein
MGVEDKKEEHREGRRLLAFARSALFTAIMEGVASVPFLWVLWETLSWIRSQGDLSVFFLNWTWVFVLVPVLVSARILMAALRNTALWWENRQEGRHLLGRSGWQQAFSVGLALTLLAILGTALNGYYNRHPELVDPVIRNVSIWLNDHKP